MLGVHLGWGGGLIKGGGAGVGGVTQGLLLSHILPIFLLSLTLYINQHVSHPSPGGCSMSHCTLNT